MLRQRILVVAILVFVLVCPAWAQETTVRVFKLHHVSVLKASKTIDPMLSEIGSVTLEPRQSRLTVQDRPEVVAEVAEVLTRLDRKPDDYRLRVELLEGSSEVLEPRLRAKVDPRLRRMFHFAAFRRLGVADFEGQLGDRAMASLGSGYRIAFVPESLGVSEDSPYHIPDPGTRLQLQGLVLERVAGNGKETIEVLRTRVVLSPKQEVYIGAGGSEDSDHGLVLILKALPGGEK